MILSCVFALHIFTFFLKKVVGLVHWFCCFRVALQALEAYETEKHSVTNPCAFSLNDTDMTDRIEETDSCSVLALRCHDTQTDFHIQKRSQIQRRHLAARPCLRQQSKLHGLLTGLNLPGTGQYLNCIQYPLRPVTASVSARRQNVHRKLFPALWTEHVPTIAARSPRSFC